MTTDTLPFKVLFCFENESRLIIEIKRTDIQSEDKSLIYKWIFIQNEKQNENEISVLSFQSMESSGERQIRTFAEGILTWNTDEAVFNDEKLAPVDVQLINQKYLMLISDFLVR
jgi:lipopolysaccharide export LptBFGC system permease protein LptF